MEGFMFEDFDHFSNEHNQRKLDHERIEREAGSQWKGLLDMAFRFGAEDKEFDGHTFAWRDNLQSLLLDSVVARFSKGSGFSKASGRGYSVTFCRAPEASGQYTEESPIPDKSWTLELKLQGKEFVWSVTGYQDCLSPKDVVLAAARELSDYHLAYREALG
jgi:hypothetical protein